MKKHALKMFSMILFVVMAFSTNVFAADVNSDHGNFLRMPAFFMPAGTKTGSPETQKGGAACRVRTMISQSLNEAKQTRFCYF